MYCTETPISIAEQFNKFQKKSDSAWIFTSATLSINGSFDHFTKLLGLEKAKTQYLHYAMSHGVNRATLKAGKIDNRVIFLKKLINKIKDIKYE